MRKARYHRYPNLVTADWEVRVCSDQKVMKQTHVGHGLLKSGHAEVDWCLGPLTNVPGVDRRFTMVWGLGDDGDRCVVWMMFAGYSQRSPALMQWLHSGCLSLHFILRRLQL